MNDRSDSDLDQARDAIDALAQQVDTAAAWNGVEAAVEHLPRARARRRLQLAAAMASVIAIVGGVAYAAHSRTGKSAVEVTEPSTTTAAPADCVLPALPVPGSGAGSVLSTQVLGGPAVASLQGGAALSPFALDGGQLTVTPPRPGDAPSVSATEAECAALASISPNGLQLLDLASMDGGAAVGYGRVSVSPELVAKPQPYFGGQTNQDTQPILPAAADYQDRLAWIVVVRNFVVFHGRTAPTMPASSHGYIVFLVDAQTGSDALLYAERAYSPAAVTVPAERVSVPWTLLSRSPNGYAGEISATVLPCDGYPNPVNVDYDRAAASVVVERPVGPSCGDPQQVTIALHAATVTSDLPDQIDHGPLGPYVTLQSSSSAKSPDETGGVLRLVTERDNGKTIDITVGSVLAFSALHVSGNYAADPVTSTDPTVLGLLSSGNGEGAEFRAWRAGHADLWVDGGCSSAQSCAPLWILHVNVT